MHVGLNLTVASCLWDKIGRESMIFIPSKSISKAVESTSGLVIYYPLHGHFSRPRNAENDSDTNDDIQHY